MLKGEIKYRVNEINEIISQSAVSKVAYLISLSVSPKVPWLVNAIAVQLQRFDGIALYFRTSVIIRPRLDYNGRTRTADRKVLKCKYIWSQIYTGFYFQSIV